jgi:hypothetical protein
MRSVISVDLDPCLSEIFKGNVKNLNIAYEAYRPTAAMTRGLGPNGDVQMD